jgi:hypothetical protein
MPARLLRRLSLVVLFSLATTIAPLASAADEPAKRDPFTLPAGYSNARTATDPAKPQPTTEPGELRSYATLHSLGFEWDLAGDTNHNAVCKVAYKRADEASWHDALPLFRVDYFGWYLGGLTADRPYNMLAGSILFLRPGAEYVVKLSLADPDGGNTEREVTLATRPIPDYGKPERMLHVVPGSKDDDKTASGDGSQEKPFRGIEEAERAARPGDMFLLHAGDYDQAFFDRSGTASAAAAGSQPKYIVWKGAGDGEAKFRRAQMNASYLWFEGLSFVRSDDRIGFRAGDGETTGNVVRANTFRGYGYSIYLSKKARGYYVADNDIIGDEAGGIAGEGVEMNKSSDHTVCYNRATKVADGTSYPRTNCDVFGNDFFGVSDDGIEPDYGYANNRMWGNRLEGHAGITFQPMFCGPWYIVRNQVISDVNVFKLRVQDRYLVTNNTFVGYTAAAGSKVPHAHGLLTAMMRNNLWILDEGPNYVWGVQVPLSGEKRDYMRGGVLFDTLKADWRTDIDYDGFDWSSGNKGKIGRPTPFNWNGARLEDLSALAANVGIERHGVVVDKHKIFERYTPPPYEPGRAPVFTLRNERTAAVDAGAALPNVAEEFAGTAPDLGAYEAGAKPPHVGPRGADWQKVHTDWGLKHQR